MLVPTTYCSADREAKASAAILATGTGIGLLESFKNKPLIFIGDADTGIGDLEPHYDRCLPKHWMTAAPIASSARDFEAHAAPFGKFESVGQEVFQDLLQSLGVITRLSRRLDRFDLDTAAFRLVAKRPRRDLDYLGEENFFYVHGDGAGLDLGQIEDIGNQI